MDKAEKDNCEVESGGEDELDELIGINELYMTLKQFIKKFDFPGTVVLLEGKRKVEKRDVKKLIHLGETLSAKTKHMVFRSGNAAGTDFYFSSGVTNINAERMEVIAPYSGHRKQNNNAQNFFSLDKINLANEHRVIALSKLNKGTERLIDPFVSGDVNRITIKAAYIIRDTIKVTGIKKIKPATFALFYDDLKSPKAGGTGHTINVCEMINVQHVNQNTWMKWIEE